MSRALAGPSAVTPGVIVLLVPVAWLGAIDYNSSQLAGSWASRIVGGLAGSLAMAAVLLCGWQILARRRSLRPGSWLVSLGVFAFAGVVRGVVEVGVGGLMPVSQQRGVSDIQWIAQSVVFVVLWATIFAVLQDLLARYRRETSVLRERERVLKSVRQSVEVSLAEYQLRLADTVRLRILPALQTSRRSLAMMMEEDPIERGQMQQVATELRDLASGVVRPVSHRIDEGVELPDRSPVVQTPRRPADRRFSWRSLVRDATVVRPIQPVTSLVIGLTIVLGVVVQLSVAWAYLLAGFALSTTILAVAKVAVVPGLRSVSVSARILRLALVFVLSSLAFCVPAVLLSPAVPVEVELWWAALLFLGNLGMVLALAFAAALVSRSQKEISRRQAVVAATDWEVGRLSRDSELVRHELAHAIHTDVQGMVSGAALRLDICLADTAGNSVHDFDAAARPAILDALRALDSAIGLLEPPVVSESRSPRVNLESGLAIFAEAWQNLVEVEIVDCDNGIAKLDEVDSVARATVEVVGEAISNAARHGAARRVRVSIAGDGLITVDDDGSGPTPPIVAGTVFQDLEQAGGTWKITPSALGGARVVFSLPQVEFRPVGD